MTQQQAIAMQAQHEVLMAELAEIKEVTNRQAAIAEQQAEAAKTQAENIRLMIEMVNRKQA